MLGCMCYSGTLWEFILSKVISLIMFVSSQMKAFLVEILDSEHSLSLFELCQCCFLPLAVQTASSPS